MKVSYQWLQTYFAKPLPPAEELANLLALHAFEIDGLEAVGDDVRIDVDVLPNRSSDSLSHRGIAREVAALLATDLIADPLRSKTPMFPEAPHLTLNIDQERCARYMAVHVEGLRVGPSPEWLKKSLETIGQRSINNVVDATNYVMQNLGQPLHAFDAFKLNKSTSGNISVGVRLAKDGEKITTLTGEEYVLTSDDLLITDANTNNPIAIAGVKGGKVAEVTTETTSIVIESANFHFASVRRTSRRHKLITDASIRYQNEPSPELIPYASRDVAKLITEIAGGVVVGAVEVNKGSAKALPVSVTPIQATELLGVEITSTIIRDVFTKLDFSFKVEVDTFVVTPPFERTDIRITEDLIEEIGRVYGYEKVNSTLPPSNLESKASKQYQYQNSIRDVLISLGFSEVITYALRSSGQVELENPLTAERKYLRSALSPGLHDVLLHNEKHLPLLGDDSIRIFEIGSVFPENGEHLSLAIAASGKNGGKIVQEAIDSLESELKVACGVQIEGGSAEINLDAILLRLSVPKENHRYPFPKTFIQHVPYSQFPFALRDIAVWTPKDTSVETVENIIRTSGGTLLSRMRVFDRFQKEDKVSYAFSLVFVAPDHTLTDVELDQSMQGITNALHAQNGWTVR